MNKELLSYKLSLERTETLYVITSRLYAGQGLFKVGKTKALTAKDRLLSLNTSHVPGDDLFIAAEFKTNDAKHLEARAHELMRHHRVGNAREWFHLPFRAICRIISMINDNLHSEQDTMNEITQILHDICCTDPDKIQWDEGVPLMIEPSPADEKLPAAATMQIQFTFSIKGWSPEQTKDFIVSVLEEYRISLYGRKGSWSSLSKLLIDKFKPHCKQPKVNSAREQIAQLCKDYNIVLK